MTNKEIEEAWEVITDVIHKAFGHPMLDRVNAQDKLDALCTAARQPESLVGKRVAVRMFGTMLAGTITSETRTRTLKHNGSQAGPCAAGELTLFEGGDFELLEDNDARQKT